MITPDQAVAIMKQRGLGVELREIDVGPRWVAIAEKGLRVRAAPGSTPEEALEAAEAYLAARETATEERRARRILQLQQGGEYFHLPRQIAVTDPETGEIAAETVFDIRRTEGNQATPIRDSRTVVEAWVRLAKALGLT